MALNETRDELDRLYEIHDEMRELLREAKEIVDRAPSETTRQRARGYWLSQMEMALDHDHEWVGRSMCTMMETIVELENDMPF